MNNVRKFKYGEKVYVWNDDSSEKKCANFLNTIVDTDNCVSYKVMYKNGPFIKVDCFRNCELAIPRKFKRGDKVIVWSDFKPKRRATYLAFEVNSFDPHFVKEEENGEMCLWQYCAFDN